MKKLLSLFLLLAINLGFSQDQDSGVKTTEEFSRSPTALAQISSGDARSLGGFSHKNPKRRTEGSIHLFDKWENNGIIVAKDGKRYSIRNINLNLKQQSFQSLYEDNKVFTFNFNNVDRFIINNKPYKNYYFENDVNVYQIIYASADYEILKGFSLKFVEGSANPMLNRSTDRYIQKEYYYIKEDDKIKKFKLKKSKVLKRVDKNKVDALLEYVDQNDLSFRKEADVKQMLEYIN